MKYSVQHSKAFKKSLKKLDKALQDEAKAIIKKLANDETLEIKHNDHALKGKFKDFRECHIKPDLLLIYQKYEHMLILVCIDIGSHSKLFKS